MAAGVAFSEPTGQGWAQFVELALALVMCSAIGLERELRRKSAGMRTHAIVGLGSALFMLVSKYGFTDVLSRNVVLDPSRMAAQIVSGIGFIGAGIIFVRRDNVRGLTTAAAVWISAAVGTACGAGLPLLAVFVTAAYFLIVRGYPLLLRNLRSEQEGRRHLNVEYLDGHGLLGGILGHITSLGYVVTHVATTRSQNDDLVRLSVDLVGSGDAGPLVSSLSDIEGVQAVRTDETPDADEE
ncbi:MgtC/SapB family protein [Rudaeicoccus suwonensis]|uniref:Putative Mg2+ transporter-C (MgtC) family protein n=1 Tax=Rudaeicoccus suwonensis TaxID=657409 RepID=A0A561E3N8_9MICO|nr:MgtC/SapB family protein [Rudaeicoccus suwonensis]TWE10228.1 putative Mg2+ transporter-C (MgtC) family protein [Rudaeicoccus suwonensis]